jgi:hypothetical protein
VDTKRTPRSARFFSAFDSTPQSGQVSCSSCSRPSSRPQFWNLNPSDFFVGLLHKDSLHPARLVFVFAVPIILCWLITRDLMLVLEFAFTYLGIVLFANIWGYSTRGGIFGLHCLSLGSPSTVNRIPAGQLGCWDHFLSLTPAVVC